MPIQDEWKYENCSGDSADTFYAMKESPKSDASWTATDFSMFEENDSMQIVPPTTNNNTLKRINGPGKRREFVNKCNGMELVILKQPEEQHRARYMSEGSRGAVKDRSGKSFCTISLVGYSRPVVLEIFAATAHGPIQPHPLYQVIAVTGKSGSATQCRQTISENSGKCLQVVLRPDNKMTAVLDCIGILKICSYNLKRKLSKQNRSSAIRLAFRANIPHPSNNGEVIHLQTVSAPIVCVQQLGYPDITKISKRSDSVKGASEMFIIGKNFANNSTVRFREYNEDGSVKWAVEADVEKSTRHSCHLICSTPTYANINVTSPVEVYVTVECGKKISRPISFTYLPDPEIMKPITNTTSTSPVPLLQSTDVTEIFCPNPPITTTSNDPNLASLVTTDIPISDIPISGIPPLEQPLQTDAVLPTLEYGYEGQPDVIDACISMSGIVDTTIGPLGATDFGDCCNVIEPQSQLELRQQPLIEDPLLRSFYSDFDQF